MAGAAGGEQGAGAAMGAVVAAVKVARRAARVVFWDGFLKRGRVGRVFCVVDWSWSACRLCGRLSGGMPCALKGVTVVMPWLLGVGGAGRLRGWHV